MPQKFTHDHLIALLYNEINPQTRVELLAELRSNPVLADDFSDFSEISTMLDDSGLDPHPTSLAIIMEHSARTHEVQHA